MKKILCVSVVIILGCLALTCLATARSLPPPQSIPTTLEKTIFERMSIRVFTNQTITDTELSTILYDAMGQRPDGSRTNPGHNGTYSTVLYVLLPDAAYTYAPANHSLIMYKPGDWRTIVGYQYQTATLVLGFCYNTTQANSNEGGLEIGQICQNIAFTLDALNLSGVVTGGLPPAINNLSIPPDQRGLIVYPIGHPLQPYHFKNHPMWISRMQPPTQHTMNLTAALTARTETTNLSGTLTQPQIDQLIWATDGFSPYLDRSHQDLNTIQRHRTTPSAKGEYPLDYYAVTPTAVTRYQPSLLKAFGKPVDRIGLPILARLIPIADGDHRAELAAATDQPGIASAPLTLVAVLDTAKTHGEQNYTQFWFLEAGAALHTTMLQATSLGLQTCLATPTSPAAVAALLTLTTHQAPVALLAIAGT